MSAAFLFGSTAGLKSGLLIENEFFHEEHFNDMNYCFEVPRRYIFMEFASSDIRAPAHLSYRRVESTWVVRIQSSIPGIFLVRHDFWLIQIRLFESASSSRSWKVPFPCAESARRSISLQQALTRA